MMNHKLSVFSVCAVLATAGVLLVGCGGEEEEVVDRTPQPPPPPPPPRVPDVEELMDRLQIDERVMLFEENAPDSEEERVAVLEFFDAFARGNHQEARRRMSPQDADELKVLVDAGLWQDETAAIEEILLETGRSPHGDKCVLAIYLVDGQDQVQLWYYQSVGGEILFESVPMPPELTSRLSGNWIEAWHEILEQEEQLAMQPDEDIEMPQRDIDQGEDSTMPSSRPSGPSAPNPLSPDRPSSPSSPGSPTSPTSPSSPG